MTQDRGNSESTIESYTISITYPDSTDHMKDNHFGSITIDREVDGQKSQLTALGHSPHSSLKEFSFEKQASRMVRCLCVLLQTLKPLPPRKYLTMHLTYYDLLTPKNYEPPGFQSSIFDRSYLHDPKFVFKHQFASVASLTHALQLSLCTTVEEDREEMILNQQRAVENVPKGLVSEIEEDTRPSLSHHLIEKPNYHLKEMMNADKMCSTAIQANHECLAHHDAIVPYQKSIHHAKNNKQIDHKSVCICKNVCEGGDMIMCDTCKSWIHTPCAGFFNNHDTRIPKIYVCLRCALKPKPKLMLSLIKIAQIRRAISIVHSAKIHSIIHFRKIMNLSSKPACKLLRRLEDEQILSRSSSANLKVKPTGRHECFIVHKTNAAKQKIRYYFGLDLMSFPEIAIFMGDKNKSQDDQMNRHQYITTASMEKTQGLELTNESLNLNLEKKDATITTSAAYLKNHKNYSNTIQHASTVATPRSCH